MNNNAKITIISFIIISGIWYSNKLLKDNNTLERDVENKAAVLQDMENVAGRSMNLKKYCESISEYLENMPTSKTDITSSLESEAAIEPINLSIKVASTETIGPFEYTQFQIQATELNIKQLAGLVTTADKMSIKTPTLSVLNNDVITANISIYALSKTDNSN